MILIQPVPPAEMYFLKEQEELISVEVQTLFQKGAVCLMEDHQVAFASGEFEGPQQVHPRGTLQDGTHDEGSGETGRLVSKN